MKKQNWIIEKTSFLVSKLKRYFAATLLLSLSVVATGSADLNIATDSAQTGSTLSVETILPSPTIITPPENAVLSAKNKLEDQNVSYEEEFKREKDTSRKYLKNRLVIKFKDGISDDDKRSIVRKVGGKFIREDLDLLGSKIIYAKREDAENLLSGDPRVEDVHKQGLLKTLDYWGGGGGSLGGGIGSSCSNPNDPKYCNGEQWALGAIGTPAGWGFTKGSGTVAVAVLDDGYDIHRDTDVGRMVLGKNYIDGSSNVTDDTTHGTKVASIIAAKTNNGQDIAAVNWKTKVLIGKVNNAANEGTVQDLAAAINDVVTNPIYSNLNIRVINLSVASVNDVDFVELRDAIGNAHNHNVLVVAAAKNEEDFLGPPVAPEDCFIGFPAAYWQVVSVVAVWRDANSVFHHSSGCNRKTLDGNTYSGIDISAPGSDITTLLVTNDGSNTVGFGQGTSIAAPFVSGTAAAVAACIPNFTVTKLKDALLNPAQDIGASGVDGVFGNGVVFYGGTVIYNSYYQNCPSN